MQREDKGRALLAHIDSLVSELGELRSEVSAWLEEQRTAPSDAEPVSPSAPAMEHPRPSSPRSQIESELRRAELNLDERDDDIVFVPKQTEMSLDKSFEPQMFFHPRRAFSVADTFLYANELCWGNRMEFETMLDEIEKLSSWSQLEHYIYNVLRLDRESREVQRFMEELRGTVTTSGQS